MKQTRIHQIVLLLLVVVTTIVVGVMVKGFAMIIFLAALTAALASPLNRLLLRKSGGKNSLAASGTLVILLLGVLLPLIIVVGMFIGQAIQVSQKIEPKIRQLVQSETAIDDILEKIPYGDKIVAYQDVILEKGGQAVSSVSLFAVDKLSSFTFQTINSLFLFFLYIYALFFFIRDGGLFLDKLLYYLPLSNDEESRLLERFTSVAKATLKGTLLIGFIQGALAGIAMGIAGIESALFWSIIMMILSVIPVIGTILVWLPAGIILIMSGSVVAGILLLVWCGVVVGNIDNLLRPVLVGQESGLHELIILFSTLGGLSLFGMTGFIVGPILASLCVTLWEMYGETFAAVLPPVVPRTVAVESTVPSEANTDDDNEAFDDEIFATTEEIE